MNAPDPLSPPARDLLHRLEELARSHPDASAPGLVLTLAVEYIPGRLKKERWWRR